MQVGRYRFVDRLAVGGMAEVFVAIAQGTGGFEKPVVIKLLLPQLAAIARFRQMFLDEARITANLQHGNIVQVLDMGSMDQRPFLALEYVNGRDLRTVYLRAQDSGTKVPPGLMAYIAVEVCRALDYAHRKQDEQGQPLNIVHRDVNPANVFLSHEGEVKVGDFGLAKARDNLEQSEVGLIKGKFSYMSPEQARGENVDHRSDIFSLGTTLYEITCGQLPFVGNSDLDVLARVREGAFELPSALRPDFDRALEQIIARAMKPDAQERYPTADDMRRDLERYVQRFSGSMGDRNLQQFLDSVFPEHQRRSQSHLIRLPPTSALPPPMTSISSRVDGLSEYQHSTTPPPPVPQFGQSRPVQPDPRTGPMPLAQQERLLDDRSARFGLHATGPRLPPAPPVPVAAPRRRSLVFGVVGGLLFTVVIGGLLAYQLLRPRIATLRIRSTPSGAQVLLDGRLVGQRTPAELRLRVGHDYQVALEHEQAGPVEQRFRFQTEGSFSHAFHLPPREQALSVESVPEAADVEIDGELRGQTPLVVHLRWGEHRITLRKRGHADKTIHHRANRVTGKLAIKLELAAEPPPEAPARVAPGASPADRASSSRAGGKAGGQSPFDTRGRPAGTLEVATDIRSRVFLNGRYVGRTPNFRMRLPVGRYSIMVKPLESKIVHQAMIEIQRDRTHRLRLTPAP